MKQAEQLQRGLAKLGPKFVAHLCEVCEGAGEYEQSYTIGCGMGSMRSMGKCDWCTPTDGRYHHRGLGLMVTRHHPATLSVFNQVMEAGK